MTIDVPRWAFAIPASVLMMTGSAACQDGTVPRSRSVAATAFAAYKFEGPEPLPLREAKEDWEAARRRAASDPAVRKWLDARRKRLGRWIARGGDQKTWVAGWAHNLVDLKKGTPLRWSWTMPEPPAHSTAERRVHGAWVYFVRQQNIALMLDAARFWRLTGDVQARDWAASQLDLYARAYRNWPLQTSAGRSRLMGTSLGEAVAATTLTEVARLIGPAVSPARRQTWRRQLFAPMLVNIESSNLGRNNIAVWKAAAAAMLAIELDDDDAWNRAIDGPNGIRAMLSRGVTQDYLWFEPSLGYGTYTQQALATLFLAASLAGRADELRDAMLTTQTMVASQAATRFSDGTLPAYGDGPANRPALSDWRMVTIQRTMPIRIPELPFSWEMLIDPDIPFAKAAPAETQSQFWPHSQLAMLRQDRWELFTHWGQLSASHAQPDALSWELRYNGIVVSGAVGVGKYGSRLYKEYLRKAIAHNMPMISGRSQSEPGRGRLLRSDATSLTVQNERFADNTTVVRSFELARNAMQARTEIKPPDGRARRLGGVFNTPCAVQPAIPMTGTKSPRGEGFEWWRNVRGGQPATHWKATLDCKGGSFSLEYEADQPIRPYVASAPDATGAYTRSAVYVEATAPALALTLRIAPR